MSIDSSEELKIVYRTAWRFSRQYGAIHSELLGPAWIGLCKAKQRYNRTRGPFVNYAITAIWNSLLEHISEERTAFAMPRSTAVDVDRIIVKFGDRFPGRGELSKFLKRKVRLYRYNEIRSAWVLRSKVPTDIDTLTGRDYDCHSEG